MNKLFTALTAVAVVLLFWIFASYADIVADNNKPEPVHSKYNFEIVLEKAIKG